MERTADGYAMQLPLLAPTDELPGVAGLPEVRHCTPAACPVFVPSRKEAVHATAMTELYPIGHAGQKAAPCGCLLCPASTRSAASAVQSECCGQPQPHTAHSAPNSRTYLVLQSSGICAASLQLQCMLLKSSQLGSAVAVAAAAPQATALLCLHPRCRVHVLLLQAVAGKLSIRDVLYNKAMRDLLVVVDCSQHQLEELPVPDPQSLLKLHTEGDIGGIIITSAGGGSPPFPQTASCWTMAAYVWVLLCRTCSSACPPL